MIRACCCLIAVVAASLAAAQDRIPTAKASAPADHVLLRNEIGGAYFVSKELQAQRADLESKVELLEREIKEGKLAEAEATRRIALLKAELEKVLAEMSKKTVLVRAATANTVKETGTFPLPAERCLFIQARRVKIVGWDKPEVKWELEKTVLTVGDKEKDLAEPELKAIRLARRDVPSSVFRFPHDPFRNDEATFAARSPFEQIWNRDLTVLELEGLEGTEGNSSITIELTTGEGRSLRSEFRRHARLTLYVPKCDTVAVRGALNGLAVESLPASLAVSGEGDRDYGATYEVRGLKGNLTARGVPWTAIHDVEGDVAIVQTDTRENSGTTHSDDVRVSYVEPPKELTCRNVRGNFRAIFSRANLRLEQIGGRIDLRNDYGDTTLRGSRLLGDKPEAKVAHRIVSQSGRIDVQLPAETVKALPISALTETGTVRVRGLRDVLDDVQFRQAPGEYGRSRTWRGFWRRDDRDLSFHLQFEIDRVLKRESGWDRPAALHLISHAGQIAIETLK